MANQIDVRKIEIVNDGLVVVLSTTNDDYPGETVRFSRKFDDQVLSAAEMRAQVITLVDLYWQLRGLIG